MIDIKVPAVGESISEVTLVKWLKKEGEYVDRDEVIAELESEKATFEVNAEKAGVLKTVGKEGDTLKIGDVVAQIDESAPRPEGAPAEPVSAPAASANGSHNATAAAPNQSTAPVSSQSTGAPAAQGPVTAI
ncbi:MAG TPA: biotin/lipoyl-containing protein, partial [Puia sp.]|nr:biotin/lipoyl-containing protein [Puia sp.]